MSKTAEKCVHKRAVFYELPGLHGGFFKVSHYTINELMGAVRNPCKIIKHLGGKGWFKWIPDEIYLKICYRGAFGKKLNLDNPKAYNEKLQWLKLYDRNPSYTKMVDKYAAKEYVADQIGAEYIIPTYGIWDSFDEIDFHALPEQFVLKCTHDSGGLVICTDKRKFDYTGAKKKIEKSQHRDFFYVGREWAYKNVKPRIIAEKYMEDLLASDYKAYQQKRKVLPICKPEACVQTGWNTLPFAASFPHDGTKPLTHDAESIAWLLKRIESALGTIYTWIGCTENECYFCDISYEAGGCAFHELLPEYTHRKYFPEGVLIDADNVRLFIHPSQEEFIINQNGLADYKFYCFNGEPRFLYLSTNMTDHENAKLSFYDLNFDKLPFDREDFAPLEGRPVRPQNYEKMIELARKLSYGIPFIRVDLYEINGRIYFSELTLYPCDGFMPFDPAEYDEIVGQMLSLPLKSQNWGLEDNKDG